MKTLTESRSFNPSQQRGFALVITLSLMILLTVIAVGLLTLSSISLRSTSQGEAMATARANARMALLLAIGDLQKYAGSDQRITARADVLDNDPAEDFANPRLTGVWESQELEPGTLPTPANYDQTAREQKFLGWLTSSVDGIESKNIAFAAKASKSAVTLWGKGTLGDTAASDDIVKAAKLPTSGKSRGTLAWAVMDEGVKVRINTPYQDGATTRGMQTAQLGSGERPGVEFIAGLNGLGRDYFKKGAPQSEALAKGITRLNFSLAGENIAGKTIPDALKSRTHDVTTFSTGLFTDTASGGLKQDFQLLTNSASLPDVYRGKGVYNSLLDVSGPSDPRWESLQEFAGLYRNNSKWSSTGDAPVLKTQTPNGWFAAKVDGDPDVTTVTTVNRTPPPGLVLLPTIAKVQMLISLIGRDLYNNLPDPVTGPLTADQKKSGMHGPQDGYFRASKYDYDLHLLYAPIVTLHNPYNVALEFTDLKIEFIHVPFAMKINRSGEYQTPGFVTLEHMMDKNDGKDGTTPKGQIFVMNLKTEADAINKKPNGCVFKLMPGEVKMFSPYINPDLNYLQRDKPGEGYWAIYLSKKLTTNMHAKPGWPGDGVGFDCDWLGGNQLISGDHMRGHWGGCIGLAWDDKIFVEFVPKNDTAHNKNKFAVNMRAKTGSSSAQEVVSSIELDYEKPTGLQDFIAGTGATMPMRYPKADAKPNYVTGLQLVDRCTTPIKAIKNVKAFALLSFQAKSTSGAKQSSTVDGSNVDGRLATKPWSFAHANIGASSQKVLTEHSANFSHEFDMQRMPGKPDDWIDSDPQGRTHFVSGHTATNGVKFGIQYEIPIAPLQSLAGLNGANPGGSSGYLPRFAQPIGNSWAHPLISADKLREPKTGGDYLDHSFLLNFALYDKFYFSGLADQTGSFGTGKSTKQLAGSFAGINGLDDPRLIFYTPAGKDPNDLEDEVEQPDAYTKVAAWQMMMGAFNINSTSVPAWKAMLASIHDSDAIFSELDTVNSKTSIAELPATKPGEKARISRFRLPAAPKPAEIKSSYWMGPREYSDDELQKLAENIIEQIRIRGPALSMADFVNRRLGSASDQTSQRGVLQQAIDDSNLNRTPANQASASIDITPAQVSKYKYANPTAGTGMSSQGAPGYLTQADILNVLGNAATPRSDTFTIRSYGEAHDASGKVVASATCEAVVQRVPEWIDPIDAVEKSVDALASEANKTFGRRFLVTSFRWLDAKEI